jgi:pimeloyl-ACP methyl ester carboxylesterase
MAKFVLVHGAWGGAHGFRHVRRLLRAERHEVSSPSLTGVGERVHLSSPLVGLGTHIRDVVNHVLYEDLDNIVLVGFSYGGFVVTGALEHIAECLVAPARNGVHGSSHRVAPRGDRATALIKHIRCEKIRGCGCSGLGASHSMSALRRKRPNSAALRHVRFVPKRRQAT